MKENISNEEQNEQSCKTGVSTRFLIMSLKWTNKKDKWITFWRKNSAGYCWFKEWTGLYNENCFNPDLTQERFIDSEKLEGLWIKIKYEGYEREVLPNTLNVRKILGITKEDLKALHPSCA